MGPMLKLARSLAHDWVDQQDVQTLMMSLPTEVFEEEESRVKRAAARRGAPMIAVSHPEAVKTAPAAPKKKRRGRIPMKPGSFTEAKKLEVLQRVGKMPIKTKEYNKLRDEICRDLQINRRQLTMYVEAMRKVNAGTSHIHLARAANGRVSKKGAHKK